jgi:hypothetical protein
LQLFMLDVSLQKARQGVIGLAVRAFVAEHPSDHLVVPKKSAPPPVGMQTFM